MNDLDKKRVLRQLDKIYAASNPLIPDSSMIALGERLFPVAKEAMNAASSDESYVAAGYYSMDITPRIGHLPCVPNTKILFINLLRVEFSADFQLFSKNPDKEHFLLLISKYMRNIEYASKELNAAAFYNWIYNRYIGNANFDYRKHLNSSGAASVFLLLHEWAHSHPDLTDSAIKLFRMPPSNSLLERTNNKDLQEIACDFTALVYVDTFDFIAKSFHCEKNEGLEAILLEVYLTEIYSLFSRLLFSSLNAADSAFDETASKLTSVLKNRIGILGGLMKIAQNSDLYFADYDISSTLDTVGKAVHSFLVQLAAFLQESLAAEVEAFNSLSEEEQKKYEMNMQAIPWIHFS